MNERPSADDLHPAAEWMGVYEGAGADDTAEQACRDAGIGAGFARKAMAQVDVEAMQLDHHKVTWGRTRDGMA